MTALHNSLFIPGPTNMPDPLRRAMDLALQDHRAPDIPNFTLPLFKDLKSIFKTKTGRCCCYLSYSFYFKIHR